MTLGELIKILSDADPNKVVRNGFGEPDSYRGYYHELAFSPKENVTVAEMLESARSALGKVFEGYKGGEYEMTEHTGCWLSKWGEAKGPGTMIKLNPSNKKCCEFCAHWRRHPTTCSICTGSEGCCTKKPDMESTSNCYGSVCPMFSRRTGRPKRAS